MRKLSLFFCAAILLAGCATSPTRSVYYRDTPAYNYSQPVYTAQPAAPTPQEEYNKKIIKQGLLGAATGAIASGASGGKAGQGALIGAGTNVIGGALFDMLTAPQAQQPQYPAYTTYANQWSQDNQNKRKIVRKYDSNGNVVSEEVWQQ